MSIHRIILIDDDEGFLLVSKIIIRRLLPEATVVPFSQPRLALDFLINEFIITNPNEKTILFLDVNMPGMSGWDFLRGFDALPDTAKQSIRIYMLSSSIDSRDEDRAKDNPSIVEFISKPLSLEKLDALLQNLNMMRP
ncbi:MAG: response regulator [Bacteroidetes bacterium]|nr:response regulator [Bacteroidota bacterium]